MTRTLVWAARIGVWLRSIDNEGVFEWWKLVLDEDGKPLHYRLSDSAPPFVEEESQ